MKKITKSTEPREWTQYKMTPGVEYNAIPELRQSLLKEQGYICAFCSRRIPVKDKNSSETSRIEHLKSRTNHPDLQLDYNNMVVCCPGAILDKFLIDNSDKSKEKKFHCDNLKGENDISFDIFSDSFFSTLSYRSYDGTIKSSNDQYNKELNNILNLNKRLLKINRKSALFGVIKFLSKKSSRTKWTKIKLQHFLDSYETKNISGEFVPYCDIIIYYLQNKILNIH